MLSVRADYVLSSLHVKEAKILSEEHKAVLLVVIGNRQKGGVSKTRVGEILRLETSSYLDYLLAKSWSTATRPGS